MAPLPTVTSQDGPKITINAFLKDPLLVPTTVVAMMNQGFLADAILRRAGQADAGVVRFDESTPIYADSTVRVRAEMAEVPIAQGSLGNPANAYTSDRSLSVVITDEDKRRSNIDKLNVRMMQVKNSIIQAWDSAFISTVLGNANVNTLVLNSGTPGTWAGASYDIRNDILTAASKIDTAVDPQGSQYGFEADTIVVNKTTKYDLLRSAQFQTPYVGNIASENLKYTGKLPQKLLNYDVVVVPASILPNGTALILQKGVAGFIADEVALNATALYRDEPRKLWRSDVQRVSAIGLDQPKAACIVTGV
jgi:hypothetical protein